MIKYKVHEPIYGTTTLFVAGCSHKELCAYVKKHYDCDLGLDDTCDGQYFMVNDRVEGIRVRVCWVQEWSKKPYWMAVMMHEILHLVVRILDYKGIPIKADVGDGQAGDEAAAYLFKFFAVKYYENLDKLKVKKKRSIAQVVHRK